MAKPQDKKATPVVVKQFSGLDRLLKKVEAQTQSPEPLVLACKQAIAGEGAKLDSEAPLSTNIFRIMSDYRGRTIPEVQKILGIVEPNADLIKSTMVLLNNSGWFIFTKHSAFQDVIYTLKKELKYETVEKGVTMKTKVSKPFSMPIQAEHDPAGIIKNGEPIELSIWKAMSDRRQRTVGEVGAILTTFGIDREKAKDTLVKLAHRGWFLRQDRHGTTYYTLKKNIAMPRVHPETPATKVALKSVVMTPTISQPSALPVQKEIPMVTKQSKAAPQIFVEDHAAVKIWKAMCDHKTYLTSEVAEKLKNYGIIARTVETTISDLKIHRDWFIVGKEGRNSTYTLKPNIPMPGQDFRARKPKQKETPVQAIAAPVKPESIIEEGDTLPVMIWKVMSDHVAYTANEVYLLLQEYGFDAMTIINYMRHLDRNVQCFEVTFTSPLKYTLKRGIKKPEQDHGVMALKHAPASADAWAQLVTPLVEVIIRIKGVDLTMAEATEVTKALQANGYGHGVRKINSAPSLLTTSISIKGKEFVDEELEIIINELVKRGFNK